MLPRRSVEDASFTMFVALSKRKAELPKEIKMENESVDVKFHTLYFDTKRRNHVTAS